MLNGEEYSCLQDSNPSGEYLTSVASESLLTYINFTLKSIELHQFVPSMNLVDQIY